MQRQHDSVHVGGERRRRVRGGRPGAGVRGPGASEGAAARTRRVGRGDGTGNCYLKLSHLSDMT